MAALVGLGITGAMSALGANEAREQAPILLAAGAAQQADKGKVYDEVEEMPEFPGGVQALMRWLSFNIRYPESAQRNGVEGKVRVRFIVEPDGSVTEAEVLEGVDRDLDREALRVVRKMPRWIPGKIKGNPVRVHFVLPVNYRLPKPEPTDSLSAK